jgi:3-oxoacyl-[acyl-carrier-protein] synthase II
VLAEGAGFVILERLETALARNADIYAEIIGFSSNSSSYHIVSPQPDGADVANAIWLALKDADIKNKDIDYINAHGTSTPLNDAIETIAIKRVFQEHAYKLLISSTKSMIGHPIGAAGPIGLITATLAMKNNTVPPTINYKERDPLCDLNYVPNIALSKKIEAAMVNSFGFGGSNAVMIIKKFS